MNGTEEMGVSFLIGYPGSAGDVKMSQPSRMRGSCWRAGVGSSEAEGMN